MDKWKAGDRVRIVKLTDIDTKTDQSLHDAFHLIGRTATILEPYLNDYYDCTIQLDKSVVGLSGPILAFLHCDLEIINPDEEPDHYITPGD